MTSDKDLKLDAAIRAMSTDEPAPAHLEAAGKRLAERLGVAQAVQFADESIISSCADVQRLLGAYRAGSLSEKREMLIGAHLRDCSACRSRFESGPRPVDWTMPKPEPKINLRPRSLAWGLAASVAILLSGLFAYRAFWQVPPGVRAEVMSVDGTAYRITANGDRPLSPGEGLNEGDLMRTGGEAHAFVRLSDGSVVEVGQRSELGVGARGKDMTIALHNGAVIVQAAKRTRGHLYVRTPDCRVAVTGTVFSVNSGIKGSRVGVVEGAVHVTHAGTETLMHAGDQVTTSENLTPVSVQEQIAWSQNRDKYLVLLGQFAALRTRLEQIPLPDARFSSDLLQRVPADTLLYVSVPNLGEFLSEANGVFKDQLAKSPALQQWWNSGHEHNTEQFDALIAKIHGMSQYLGDEVVIFGENTTKSPVVIADVKQSGLADYLKSEFADANHGLTVITPAELPALTVENLHGGYALVRDHEVVFSNSAATLKRVNAQLNAGASGFASSDFGQQIAAAYGRGAGIILAADLHQMTALNLARKSIPASQQAAAAKSGLQEMQYLIAEHREVQGQTENHLNLQFAGVRQGIASWLAAPAPIGSLDFVTPNAAFAIALLTKDPKLIVDDLLSMATAKNARAQPDLDSVEQKLQINLREDLAANLGGDALVALDGPVLPTPSWKIVVEVHDSERLEKTLEQLTQAITRQPEAHGHGVGIEWNDVGGQRFYSVRDLKTGVVTSQYTFADGYMIVGPDRAILMDAMHAHAVGDSLARSAAFRALLPKDSSENYSAVAYQNLSPVLGPLLSQASGEAAAAVKEIAADSKPTAVCAWGEESRIEAASNSRLFGFDFLTLGALLGHGNNHGGISVRESHGNH